MFCGREQLSYVHQDDGPDTDSDGDMGDTADKSPTSWRDQRYNCPVIKRHMNRLSLSLRQLVNHLFITHRAFHQGLVVSSCFSTTDDDFVRNLRVMIRNVDIHNLAANAGFPMKEEDGLEMLVVKGKRRASRSPEQSDDTEVEEGKGGKAKRQAHQKAPR